MQTAAYQNYHKQEVEGASKGKIVLLLIEGAIRFLRRAAKGIEEKNIQEAHNNIIKAENIIYELMSTLNMEAGEIAENLMRLYDFIIWQLVEANKDKDKEKLESAINLLSPLRDAWKEITDKGPVQNAQQPQTAIPTEHAERKSINFAG